MGKSKWPISEQDEFDPAWLVRTAICVLVASLAVVWGSGDRFNSFPLGFLCFHKRLMRRDLRHT